MARPHGIESSLPFEKAFIAATDNTALLDDYNNSTQAYPTSEEGREVLNTRGGTHVEHVEERTRYRWVTRRGRTLVDPLICDNVAVVIIACVVVRLILSSNVTSLVVILVGE